MSDRHRALSALRRFASPVAVERCELCAQALAEQHPHLWDLDRRKLGCSCEACALLFAHEGAPRYRRVPRRVEAWPDFAMSQARWEALGLPIALAAFVLRGPERRPVALYPSPAGALEAHPDPEAWAALARENPALEALEPEVEALLIRRTRGERDCYRVGLDECFRLIGLIRTHWRGFSGGPDAEVAIAGFFDRLRGRAHGS